MRKLAAILLAGVFSTTIAYAEEKGLTGKMEVFTVTQLADGGEAFTETVKVTPGDLLEYKITYKNDSEDSFNDVGITGKIPSGTIFVMDSATTDVTKPLFTIDQGVTWSETPTIQKIVDGKITTIDAPITSYTGIKWDVETFKPTDSKVFKYRVEIEK